MPTFPFQRAKPLGWALYETLTSPQMTQIDGNAAQAADGDLWTDVAQLLNVQPATTIASRNGPMVYNLKSPTGIALGTWHSFGPNTGNVEGSFAHGSSSTWQSHAAMPVGAGLLPVAAAAHPNGDVILVGGTTSGASTQKLRRSADAGLSWSIANTAAGGAGVGVQCIAWFGAANLWIAGLSNGAVETSPDGVTWTARTTPNSDARTQIAVSATAVVITSSGFVNRAIRSTDGVNWSEVTLPSTHNWLAITYNPRLLQFFAVRLGAAAKSTDGITWSSAGLTSPAGLISLVDVIAYKRFFLLTGSHGVTSCSTWYSADAGATWVPMHAWSAGGVAVHSLAISPARVGWKDSSGQHFLSMVAGY
jgi:hypothetical protein